MTSWFDQDLTTMAFCWRLMRSDGVTLGFTSHDRDLDVGGLCYRAAPGLVPSAIELTSGFAADSVELAGALTAASLRVDDLSAGRWDGALLSVFAVNWAAPDTSPHPLVRGHFGGVRLQDDQFSVDLIGLTSQFDVAVAEETSPECRATLGDKKCRVDMAGRRMIARVGAVADNVVTVLESLTPDRYVGGRLRWVDGLNAGLSAMIVAQQGNLLTLVEAPFFPVEPAARVDLSEGCDGRFATCVARFQNAANFRGEPHLPGNDLLTRYAS
jgi:uncharacterized phage protein (TIGR02218 family)